MSKGKTLVLGIICAAWAFGAADSHQFIVMLVFAATATLFFSMCFYKCYRDWYRIPAQARQERAQVSHTLPQMTSA